MCAMSFETAETIRVICFLNELSEKSRRGFVKFSDVPVGSEVHGVVYDDRDGNRVVQDMLIDELHYVVVSRYEDEIGAPTYVIEDNTGTYVQVDLPKGFIIIENGRWMFCP